MPVLRKGRMVGDWAGQVEATEPAVCQVQMHFFAQTAFRPDAKTIADIEGLSKRRAQDVTNLALLAPDILDGIATSEQPDGFTMDYRWFSWVAVPEDDISDCSVHDVTGGKERIRALKSIEDELSLVGLCVAILGHDLRNPLAAIRSAIRLAGREPHNEKVEDMYTAPDGSVDRMAKLIDVTIDFARAPSRRRFNPR